MSRTRPRGRGGFTLMETAVTVTIMGVIAALGYAAFATLIDQRTRIRTATAETERAAALRETLEDWFARGRLSGALGGGGVKRIKVGGPSMDRLVFITRAPTPSGGWATVMLLFIDDNPATPEQGLTVRYLAQASGESARWLSFDDTQPVQTEDKELRKLGMYPAARELDRRVAGLRVEYLEVGTRRWHPEREAAAISWSKVRVTLEGTPSAPLPPLLQLPFFLALGSDP